MNTPIKRDSLVEYDPRQRLQRLLDENSARELLGPFDHITSPWLPRQGIVTQSDDGVVLMKGRIKGRPVVAIAIDGNFQGGSLGEVSGAKIATALELAIHDNRQGIDTAALLLLETGGVRLQEANLGLAAIGDIHSAIVRLRRHAPVIGVITGPVGCYGGMSIAAGLCSYLIMTREARLGLNGPTVIEQEAGIDELNAGDKPLIWSMTGGEQRCATGLADIFSSDDADTLRHHIDALLKRGIPATFRSDRLNAAQTHLKMLAEMSPSEHPVDPAHRGQSSNAPNANCANRGQTPIDTVDTHPEPAPHHAGRGDAWLRALAANQPVKSPHCAAIRYADTTFNTHACRLIAVVPDPHSPFPRARHGEIGLAEGWGLAQLIHDTIEADRDQPHQRTLIALVDVPSQAYGRLEETQGLHQALAAAVSAWIHARIAGHRVIGLIVGQAISGAYLAHGYQAHRLIALDDPGVQLHAMGKASAARVTQRSIDALDELAKTVPPMGYGIEHYKTLGLLWDTLHVNNAEHPSDEECRAVIRRLIDAIETPLTVAADALERPGGGLRKATDDVRARLQELWSDPDKSTH